MNDFCPYFPHFTSNIVQQKVMLDHIAPRAATELSNIGLSSFPKGVTIENDWFFELNVQKRLDFPIYVMFVFMQRDQFNQQQRNKDKIFIPTVASAKYNIGKNYPNARINCKNDVDKYSRAFGKTVSCLRNLTQDNTLQHCNTRTDFSTSN